MQTPHDMLGNITTRGDFRGAIKQEPQDRPLGTDLHPDHPIWDIWTLMRDQYGAQWTHGSIPTMGWVYALQDLEAAQLKQGIDNLIHREDNHWPPNAQEFSDLCRSTYAWERQCHKIWNPANKLEDMTAKEKNKEAGQAFFASLSFS